ncbi:hypothetical protein [Mesoplasma melaleucae]|nr:hypothetical protein [Mesoplasma melaleucae]
MFNKLIIARYAQTINPILTNIMYLSMLNYLAKLLTKFKLNESGKVIV